MLDKQDELAVNFIAGDQAQKTHWQTLAIAGVFTLIVAGVAGLGARASYLAASRGTSVLFEMAQLPVLSEMRQLGFSFGSGSADPAPVQKDVMNILVTGIGGEGHDGPQLTDSMLLLSLDRKQKRVAMVSIPRDLAFPASPGVYQKINSVNAYAEAQSPGEGGARTAKTLSDFFQTPIDHYVRIDFNGFDTFIDAIGGIDVNVDNAFVDHAFPTDDFGPNPNGYLTVSFEKGRQHMDAKRALTFARSRHGNHGEGSDFARSHRQQLVMLAVREKLLSLGTLGDPTRLMAIYNSINSHVQTDLSAWDILRLLPLAQEFSPERMTLRQLTDGPQGRLASAIVNGSYLLFPRQHDWASVRDVLQHPFAADVSASTDTSPPVAASTATRLPAQRVVQAVAAINQPITLEIKNGTARPGLAAQLAAELSKQGYRIRSYGNALHRGYRQSTVFDLTDGQKNVQLLFLSRLLNAQISLAHPTLAASDRNARSGLVIDGGMGQEAIASTHSDFLIILGDLDAAGFTFQASRDLSP